MVSSFLSSIMGSRQAAANRKRSKNAMLDVRDFSTSELQVAKNNIVLPGDDAQDQQQAEQQQRSEQKQEDRHTYLHTHDGTDSPTLLRRRLHEYAISQSFRAAPAPIVAHQTTNEDVTVDKDTSLDIGLTV